MVIEAIKSLLISNPKTGIIVFAIVIAFFISLVNYFVLDKEKMHVIKKRQKEIQAEMKNHKGNPTKLMELQKEMFSHMGSSLKHSMKPMIFTFLPLIIIFPLMRGIMKDVLPSWFWWYLGASLVASMIFRKLFKLP